MTTRRLERHVLAFAMISAAFVIAPPFSVMAQDVVEEEEAQEENLFEDFEELVEGAEVSPGFFDLYTKEGRLYLAVPADRLGQDFLMDMRVARGVGAAGLFGGTTLGSSEMSLMAFEKHGKMSTWSNGRTVSVPHRTIGPRPPSTSASGPRWSRAPMSRLYARTRLSFWM